MNKKIIISTIAVLVFFTGIFYITNRFAHAYEYKMTLSSADIMHKSGHDTRQTGKDDNVLDFTVKEFITQESQSDFREKVMAIKGVRNVDFGKSCPEAKVTKISVTFADNETIKENILSEINKLGFETKEYNGYHHGNSDQKECPHMRESIQEIKT